MIEITDHLTEIRGRVARALERAGRPSDDALIVAVSKGQDAAAVRAAYAAGQRDFGENYLQEAVAKIEQIGEPDIRWHFLGRVQSNKTREIAARFDWVHTLDRERIAARLAAQRPAAAAPLKVLIQVDQTQQPHRGGIPEADVPALARAVAALPRLELAGLMCLPPADADAAATASLFRRMCALRDGLAAELDSVRVLSMGMSADFELALAEGSNCVRIGTAIFGTRRTRALP